MDHNLTFNELVSYFHRQTKELKIILLGLSLISLFSLILTYQQYKLSVLTTRLQHLMGKDNPEIDFSLNGATLQTSLSLINYIPPERPPTPTFIFHNKMPKCGSTTLNFVLKELALNNNFNYEMILSNENLKNDIKGTSERLRSIKTESTHENILVMQHQTFMNFSEVGIITQPTFINVVRNPVDRFVSNYYFCRFGSVRIPRRGAGCQNMSDREINMPVEKYVRTVERLTDEDINYRPWLCGTGANCVAGDNEIQRKRAYDYTKYLVLNEYFIVGVLEHFDKTLDLLAAQLPDYFKGGKDVYYNSPAVKRMVESMRTQHKQPLNNKTRSYLEVEDFKYDMDLFRFVEAKFMIQYSRYVDRVF